MADQTATISLYLYNELRDFRNNIESNKIAIYNNHREYYTYFSNKEFEAHIIEGLKLEKDKEIHRLKESNTKLKAKLKEEKSKRRRWWNKK
tara:strand:- start:976 stop:1248 length:273 start_codon:yes stop_codon:yes gene_type:complete